MSRFKMCLVMSAGLAALLACAAAIAGAAPSTTRTVAHPLPPSGATGCAKWDQVSTCYVSWYRLLANPEAYRGRIVWITGYLVSDFGELILYPDKADYEAASEVDSIILVRPYAIPKNIADKLATDVYPVTVMGRFSPEARSAGFGIPRAGSLREIRKIVSTPRVNSDERLNMQGVRILPPEH